MPQRSGVFVCIEERTASAPGLHEVLTTLEAAGVRLRELRNLKLGSDKRRALDLELAESSAAILVVFRTGQGFTPPRWPRFSIQAIAAQATSGLKVIPVLIGAAAELHLPQEFRHLTPAHFRDFKIGYSNPAFSELLDALQETSGEQHEPQVDGSLYFSTLQVNNIRCFPQAQMLDVSARWNVILGDNGTGKTTLLRALASFSPGVHVNWIGTGTVAATFRDNDAIVTARAGEKVQLIYGYGAGRGATTAPIELSDPRSGPCATLLDEAAALPDPQEWILQSFLAAKIENGGAASQSFQRIQDTLCRKVLPEVYDLVPVVSEGGIPRVDAKTLDAMVPMKDLSFGYNVAMAWIIDLARRMFKRYPDSPDPLAEHAIVLVDEIDLHLHPKWQRELLKALDEIFKKTQFIVTAHSPLIVQSAPDANLTLLRREGDHVVIDNDVDYVRKWRVDQILASELFGEQPTHAPEVEDLFKEHTRLRSKADLTPDEQQRLKQVDDELDRLPTASNPSDIRAMEIIREAAEALAAKSRQ